MPRHSRTHRPPTPEPADAPEIEIELTSPSQAHLPLPHHRSPHTDEVQVRDNDRTSHGRSHHITGRERRRHHRCHNLVSFLVPLMFAFIGSAVFFDILFMVFCRPGVRGSWGRRCLVDNGVMVLRSLGVVCLSSHPFPSSRLPRLHQSPVPSSTI